MTAAKVLIGIAVLCAACSSASVPSAPSALAPTAGGAPAPPTLQSNPSPSRPPSADADVFSFRSGLVPPVLFANNSRFLLWNDGTFVLRFAHGEYWGTYKVSGTSLTFGWEGWSTAGPWEATGTLVGDELTVRYNLVMQLTDFEDAVYTRVGS